MVTFPVPYLAHSLSYCYCRLFGTTKCKRFKLPSISGSHTAESNLRMRRITMTREYIYCIDLSEI